MSNPITENIKCLIECGWERKEAVNLVAELYSQSEREELVKAVEDARVAWATWGAIEEAGVFDAAAWDGVDESKEGNDE
jgi:hypothetical protein